MDDVAKFSTRPGMTIITMPNSLKFFKEKARTVRALKNIGKARNTIMAAFHRLISISGQRGFEI